MPHKRKIELPPIDLGTESIGDRLKRFRNIKELTQQELADKIGIVRALVSDYERGRLRLYDEMVARFSVALDVSADVIIGLKK